MVKSKLSEFKKYIAHLDETGLRAELLKLYSKLDQVKQFYAQELLDEPDRAAILAKYKKTIWSEYWVRNGSPRMTSPNNAHIRKLCLEFEKLAAHQFDAIDLWLYRAEVAADFANQFGGMPDADYNAAINGFDRAMKLIAKYGVLGDFKARCFKMFQYQNLDYWFIMHLIECYEDATGEKFE